MFLLICAFGSVQKMVSQPVFTIGVSLMFFFFFFLLISFLLKVKIKLMWKIDIYFHFFFFLASFSLLGSLKRCWVEQKFASWKIFTFCSSEYRREKKKKIQYTIFLTRIGRRLWKLAEIDCCCFTNFCFWQSVQN